jgi:hypothetical protein
MELVSLFNGSSARFDRPLLGESNRRLGEWLVREFLSYVHVIVLAARRAFGLRAIDKSKDKDIVGHNNPGLSEEGRLERNCYQRRAVAPTRHESQRSAAKGRRAKNAKRASIR